MSLAFYVHDTFWLQLIHKNTISNFKASDFTFESLMHSEHDLRTPVVKVDRHKVRSFSLASQTRQMQLDVSPGCNGERVFSGKTYHSNYLVCQRILYYA